MCGRADRCMHASMQARVQAWMQAQMQAHACKVNARGQQCMRARGPAFAPSAIAPAQAGQCPARPAAQLLPATCTLSSPCTRATPLHHAPYKYAPIWAPSAHCCAQGLVNPAVPGGDIADFKAFVFAIYDAQLKIQYTGFSTDLRNTLRTLIGRRPDKAFYYKWVLRRAGVLPQACTLFVRRKASTTRWRSCGCLYC